MCWIYICKYLTTSDLNQRSFKDGNAPIIILLKRIKTKIFDLQLPLINLKTSPVSNKNYQSIPTKLVVEPKTLKVIKKNHQRRSTKRTIWIKRRICGTRKTWKDLTSSAFITLLTRLFINILTIHLSRFSFFSEILGSNLRIKSGQSNWFSDSHARISPRAAFLFTKEHTVWPSIRLSIICSIRTSSIFMLLWKMTNDELKQHTSDTDRENLRGENLRIRRQNHFRTEHFNNDREHSRRNGKLREMRYYSSLKQNQHYSENKISPSDKNRIRIQL